MAKEVNKEKKTEKKVKNEKDKKSFAKDFKAELKKVIWPTPKQLANSTTAVITIVLIAAIIVFALDLVFEIFNIKFLNRIKESYRNQNNTEQVIDNNVNAIVENVTVLENNQSVENNNEIVE